MKAAAEGLFVVKNNITFAQREVRENPISTIIPYHFELLILFTNTTYIVHIFTLETDLFTVCTLAHKGKLRVVGEIHNSPEFMVHCCPGQLFCNISLLIVQLATSRLPRGNPTRADGGGYPDQ